MSVRALVRNVYLGMIHPVRCVVSELVMFNDCVGQAFDASWVARRCVWLPKIGLTVEMDLNLRSEWMWQLRIKPKCVQYVCEQPFVMF